MWCGEGGVLPREAGSCGLTLGAELLCEHMNGNQECITSPKGLGAQQPVLDPPADPFPLVPKELFSLWLPLHNRHPPYLP